MTALNLGNHYLCCWETFRSHLRSAHPTWWKNRCVGLLVSYGLNLFWKRLKMLLGLSSGTTGKRSGGVALHRGRAGMVGRLKVPLSRSKGSRGGITAPSKTPKRKPSWEKEKTRQHFSKIH